MGKKVQVDIDLFKKYYVEQNKPIRVCAELLGVSISTLGRCIKANDIRKSKELIYSSVANTNIERYGVANVLQAEEVKQKIKQTCLAVYGVDNPAKAECTKQKAEKTCLERYGVAHTTVVPEFRAKMKQTNLERYGGASAFSSQQVRDKSAATNLKKYGIKYQFDRPEIRAQIEQTNLSRYGVINPFQMSDFKNKAWKKYIYNGIRFDSTWELALYIFAIDHGEPIVREPKRFKYTVAEKDHYYTPDFLYKDEFVDVKGTHLIKDGFIIDPYGHLSEQELSAKNDCIIKNNIKLMTRKDIAFALDYINKQYGKHYLKQFKNTKT